MWLGFIRQNFILIMLLNNNVSYKIVFHYFVRSCNVYYFITSCFNNNYICISWGQFLPSHIGGFPGIVKDDRSWTSSFRWRDTDRCKDLLHEMTKSRMKGIFISMCMFLWDSIKSNFNYNFFNIRSHTEIK